MVETGHGAEWSDRALAACLHRLMHSTLTEARSVTVDSSWTDGPTAFCIVYRTPWFDGLNGLRRDASDAVAAFEIKVGLRPLPAAADAPAYWHNSMTDGYDMGLWPGSDVLPDPDAFGRNVADYDIGEPHGPLGSDPTDQHGVHWRGNLDRGLPKQ